MDDYFRDRVDAGRQLAAHLADYAHRDDVVVLALPRGGVPVAFEVAKALRAPLDVLIVRKLGAPGNPELAMGAIAAGGIVLLEQSVLHAMRVTDRELADTIERERGELARREAAYRDGRAPPAVEGRTVIVVDDGIATGSTMLAALEAVRARKPAKLVAAVPVASPSSAQKVKAAADAIVCVMRPDWLMGIGQFYRNFDQTSDDEVCALLERAREWAQAGGKNAPPAQAGAED
ncbi:phosphoribosyltransferase [Burkholderia thailandensis]|uniref:Phosphoribosyl transferase domain protein n=1 Tax=Burkholderia thailandensis (strain ATCC 700388 / DSM 13276 / CCUG 48851 / CIP 106301 / E264) TaxID=271848 RepID=Q2T0W6_BURTA|nr:phosphoribosyltransferase [Burkholderia thailandensis]ABC36568.1 phosphoribosyl transferase domain protein [Burkholderia thailandensis E264]AHI74694.1 phosphoribosyl transferase domain protein [Burkholderia thailandensis 2002721723]AHI79911.1 phosphoribosyl transferase domain protein [Burkholderia thailandensis E444]AIC88448.1 phosphoribosyl transferase domain protein [Burkholderia thailandensis USAMRU Malaysia \